MNACYRTSADLFKTVFDLLVSVTLFVGRFDMRMLQVLFVLLQPFYSGVLCMGILQKRFSDCSSSHNTAMFAPLSGLIGGYDQRPRWS